MLAMAAAVFSVLLILTGAVKIARPHDVEKALVGLGFPRIPGIGVIIGGGELIVGVGALIFPTFLVAQGVLYIAFAIWVSLALRSDVPIASCGCLGRDDTPPTRAHVLLNVGAGLISAGALFGSPLMLGEGAQLVSGLVVIGVGVFLSFVVLTDAAHLEGVRGS